MECQYCKSNKIVSIQGKCSDMFSAYKYDGTEKELQNIRLKGW